MPAAVDSLFVAEDWESPGWRLDNLYTSVDDEGQEFPFRMNDVQRDFFANLWTWNLILKSRQAGFTTFIDLLALDQCLFNRNFTAGVIAHSLDDAEKIFRRKVRFPYEHLPAALRSKVGLRSETSSALEFANGSSISVSTSMRSGTLQFLHISEFGKICAKYPDKAREIVTGSFPTLKAGQMLFVESTAEGIGGYFHDYCMTALARQKERAPETMLDFRLHFFPWWRKPANVLDPAGVVIDDRLERYFAMLDGQHGIKLSPEQKAWYSKTQDVLREDMKREHPAYPEESFAQSVEGVIYAKEMTALREQGRITSVPWDPSVPVNTFWDLGMDDCTAIWFHQRVGLQNRLIRYYECAGEGMAHYATQLTSHGYTLGTHYLPHDADQRLQGETVETRAAILRRLVPGTVTVVDRIRAVSDGIAKTREFLPTCWIDADNCLSGLNALDSYRREWDEKLGRWKDSPHHNGASHAADAIRQGAQGYKPASAPESGGFVRYRDSWRA